MSLLKRCRSVVLLLAIVDVVWAQASQKQTTVVVSPVSPLELLNIVRNDNYENIKALWTKLSIDATPLDGLLDRCPCDAQAQTFSDSTKEVITVVRVGETFFGATFLVFHQARSSSTRPIWVLLGHIDFPQREIPEYSLMESASDRFLIVHAERDHGSRIGAESVEWYAVQDRGFEHVLSYPGKAYMSGVWLGSRLGPGPPFGPSVFINSDVVSFSRIGNEELLKVHFSLSLRDEERNSTVCTVERNVTFVRSDRPKFVLDANRSEITAKELLSSFDITSASFKRAC
jgi:hypothetical protein